MNAHLNTSLLDVRRPSFPSNLWFCPRLVIPVSFLCLLFSTFSSSSIHHPFLVIVPVFVFARIVVGGEGVVHATAFASLGFGVIESSAFVAPEGSTSAVDIVAARLLFGPDFASWTSFQSVYFGERGHHFLLFVFVSVLFLSLLTSKFTVLGFFAETAMGLFARRAFETLFITMLEEELASWSRAVDYFLVLIKPLLDGELLVLQKHSWSNTRLNFVHVGEVIAFIKRALDGYFGLEDPRVSPLLEALNVELVSTADHLDVIVAFKRLCADRTLSLAT